MERTSEEYKKNRKYAILGTFLFSAGLVVALLLMGMSFQDPPPREEGVEVNLGDSEVGMGSVQPEISANSPSAPPQQTSSEDQFVTQNVDEAPIAAPTDPTPTQNTRPDPQPTQPTVNQSAIYPGNSSPGGSQGPGNQPGDAGVQGGDPNSGNYSGIPGGGGNGVSYKLGNGRKHINLPAPSKNFSEPGIVVVKIWVNREGKVIKALGGQPGTTNNSSVLRRLAEQAAMKATFQKDSKATYEQTGTITYHFNVQ